MRTGCTRRQATLSSIMKLARVTAAPPAKFDNRIYLARALEQANAENPEQATRKNVDALKRLISNLDQGNSRALLFELPIRKNWRTPPLRALPGTSFTRLFLTHP